ncbi:carboxymuconolactone decarboxylase family protein [Entomomonas moraniae]|uniref:Carboxymuconolactone decarboxylase family protein n=1 Tax=Entomomonas moraniae TaxID=2213226 RepID=A0A3S9XFG0_9GAMM|nr:carboxymuconolactone decarboxylase family protein [Entomomonas moraniae]AZS51165.1 carboxymuconolactone decarboxylase family protein [Entomomonas moraniae]
MLPSLKEYEVKLLNNNVWQRSALSPRDRCLSTIAVAISLNEPTLLAQQIFFGIKHNITPIEINGIVTHLGFYCGWGKALEASKIILPIFEQLKIDITTIQPAPPLFKLNEEFECNRAKAVEENVGSDLFPNLVNDTTQVLFHDLWLRSDLQPRDRSLITVTSLIANGQVEQIGFHLGKALDNGFTHEETAELISHLAYYVGWPNAMSSIPVVKKLLNNHS